MVLRKIGLLIVALGYLLSLPNSGDTLQISWMNEWDYREAEVYPIKLQINFIPLVEVKVNGSPVWVKFDTGCSTGFSLTSAIEDSIEHKVTGKSTERNPDGSYRGETKLATIASLEVFGQRYAPVKTSFTDWRIFSSVKFNGLLGLGYFSDKRITLAYKQKRIGITSRPLVENSFREFAGAIAPLLTASGSQADLMYVYGRVRGQSTVIYLDTGSSASFIDPSMLEATEIKEGKRYRFVENIPMSIADLSFTVKRLRVQEQRRGVNFAYPQTIKLGSDVIKDFLITIDKISGKLYLAKN